MPSLARSRHSRGRRAARQNSTDTRILGRRYTFSCDAGSCGYWSLIVSKCCALSAALTAAVARRDHAPVFTGSRQAVEHAISLQRNLPDRFFPVAFAAKVGRHGANDIRTILNKHNPRVITHSLQFARLVSDLQPFRQIARDKAAFVRTQHLEEIIGECFVQNLPAIE